MADSKLTERIRASYYAEVPSKTPWSFDHEDYDLAAPMVKDDGSIWVAITWIAIIVVDLAVVGYLGYLVWHWSKP